MSKSSIRKVQDSVNKPSFRGPRPNGDTRSVNKPSFKQKPSSQPSSSGKK
ncbi:hypothetical protein J32TS6_19290 [Virgibacillus pantothenticus]|nr:hypothetical protein J32TS6_19290 [Virgibacillus pantothenticus]